MEVRKAKMVVNKSSSGNSIFRATLPNKWVRDMGLNEDTRDLKLIFKGNKIIIEKQEK